MKWYVGLVIAMLMVSFTYAQQANIGIKGGMNIYNIHDMNSSSYDSKIGFHAGLLWHMHMSQHVAFQPEVVYSLQGANLPNDIALDLGYVNVPFLLQLMFNNGFRLEAGPQLGFLVHAKSKWSDFSGDVRDNFKPIDAGLAVGFGFIGSGGLGFDLRYNHGLSNINDSGSDDFYNRGFQLGLFYQFRH